MTSASGGSPGGLMAALKNIAATLLDSVQTRLALLVNEIQAEKQQALQQLWCALGLLFCLALGLLLAVALAVLLWWEQRILVLGLFSVLFLGLAGYFYAALRRHSAASAPLFAVSLAELQEDLRQLKKATGHEPKPD
ncbi:MAG: phage holin family protein [Polaromonas sp.]